MVVKVDLATAAMFSLAQELHEALNDPKRGEWGGYPWEHLGDAERDVRVLLELIDRLADSNWCERP